MLSLSNIVRWVLYLIVVIVVLGLLWWLIGYCEANLPGMPLLWQFLRVGFVIMVVLALIYFLISLTRGGGGGSLFKD